MLGKSFAGSYAKGLDGAVEAGEAILECLKRDARRLGTRGGTVRRQRRIYSCALLCLVGLISRYALADSVDYFPPAGYYNAATGTGATLKTNLHGIIDGHTELPYTDNTDPYLDVRTALQITDDATPGNLSDHVIRLVYNDVLLNVAGLAGPPTGWDSGASWNREHSWPQSRGVDATSAPDGTDLHHLFPSDPDENSTRNNLNYGGAYGAQGFGIVSDGGSKYYPGDLDAGMVARAQFYMATRYDGTESGTQDLELAAGNPAENGTTLGDLTRLIEWHFAATPDTFERRRNQIIYDNYQDNRNPFIDHPEFVWSIFVNQTNDSRISITGSTVNADGSSTRNVDLGRVFKNGAVPAAQAFTLNKAGNNGNNGTYFEVTTNGAATSSVSGRFNAMRTNQADTKSINVGLSTSTATTGLKSGAVTIDNLDITTGGGAGRGANDANDTFNVSLAVLDHATPSFASPTLTTSLNHDFGNIAIGSSATTFNFNVYNLLVTAGYTANMDFDSVTPSGNTSAFSTNLAASAGSLVLAGGASHAFTAMLTATTVGTFTANYTLAFSDENITGALSKSLTLSLTGKLRLAGDYNGDLKVDAGDYTAWRNTMGQSVAAYSSADGDGNTTINNLDYDVWRAHFGQTASGAGSGVGLAAGVPEPSGGLLAIVGATIVFQSLRRKRTAPGCGGVTEFQPLRRRRA